MRDEKKVLDEALVAEQKKVMEIRELIAEAKEAMAAQNQQISNRIAQKEQRETQVIICILLCTAIKISIII